MCDQSAHVTKGTDPNPKKKNVVGVVVVAYSTKLAYLYSHAYSSNNIL